MCTFFRPPFGDVAPEVNLLRAHRDEEQEAEQVEQQVLNSISINGQYRFALLKCHKNLNLTQQENLLQKLTYIPWVTIIPLPPQKLVARVTVTHGKAFRYPHPQDLPAKVSCNFKEKNFLGVLETFAEEIGNYCG